MASIEFPVTLRELSTDKKETDDALRLCGVKLSALNLQIGDQLEMTYDFGCEQIIDIELTGVQDMPRGRGRSYPRIAAGV